MSSKSNPGKRLILAEALSDEVRIIGYDDGGFGITIPVEATVEETGGIAFDTNNFIRILRSVPEDEDVTFETTVKNGTPYARLFCDDEMFECAGCFVDTYPDLPTVSGGRSFSIIEEVLYNMIDMVSFAVSHDKKLPIQAGVLFEVGKDTLTLVASDGYRIALRREALVEPLDGEPFSFVVSGVDLEKLSPLCMISSNPMTVTEGTGHCMFQFADKCVIVSCLKGTFFEYRKYLPKARPIQVEADVEEFRQAIDSAAIVLEKVAGKDVYPIICKFGSDGALTIRVFNGREEGQGVCPITGNGQDLEIGFRYSYLTDAIFNVPVERVRLELSLPTAPCLILPADGEEDNFMHMVLPIRLHHGEK